MIPDYQKINPGLNSYVIVLTQHKGDQQVIQAALRGTPRYIGLVASAKRSRLVVEYLKEGGMDAGCLASGTDELLADWIWVVEHLKRLP
jgi:xanthine/CO dehydrogenase XdhC/CoxF family maturation factor